MPQTSWSVYQRSYTTAHETRERGFKLLRHRNPLMRLIGVWMVNSGEERMRYLIVKSWRKR